MLEGGELAVLLRIALLMLLWLALFAVLGGAIYESRQELGFEPERSPESRDRRDERERDRERDHFLDQIFAEYRAGARGNPWATIHARARQSPNPSAEYAWIYERVASWPRQSLADRVAQELLSTGIQISPVSGSENSPPVQLMASGSSARTRPALSLSLSR